MGQMELALDLGVEPSKVVLLLPVGLFWRRGWYCDWVTCCWGRFWIACCRRRFLFKFLIVLFLTARVLQIVHILLHLLEILDLPVVPVEQIGHVDEYVVMWLGLDQVGLVDQFESAYHLSLVLLGSLILKLESMVRVCLEKLCWAHCQVLLRLLEKEVGRNVWGGGQGRDRGPSRGGPGQGNVGDRFLDSIELDLESGQDEPELCFSRSEARDPAYALLDNWATYVFFSKPHATQRITFIRGHCQSCCRQREARCWRNEVCKHLGEWRSTDAISWKKTLENDD